MYQHRPLCAICLALIKYRDLHNLFRSGYKSLNQLAAYLECWFSEISIAWPRLLVPSRIWIRSMPQRSCDDTRQMLKKILESLSFVTIRFELASLPFATDLRRYHRCWRKHRENQPLWIFHSPVVGIGQNILCVDTTKMMKILSNFNFQISNLKLYVTIYIKHYLYICKYEWRIISL